MRWLFGIFFLFIVLAGFVIVIRPGFLCDLTGLGCEESRARSCLQATGSTTEFAPSLSHSGDSLVGHLGGKEVIEGSQNPEVLKQVYKCMRDMRRERDWPKDDYFAEQALPLGLVEDQWQGGEVSIDILEPSDTEMRNQVMNLAFGPAGGFREDLIDAWCDTNAACVTCDPSGGAGTYGVRVVTDARFQKIYQGTAPLSGHMSKPYQMVERPEDDANLGEGIGRRVLFLCKN